MYVKAKRNLATGKAYMIRIIFTQCSADMKATLNNRKGFKEAKANGDVITVLDHVRTACFDFNVAGNPFSIYWHALYRLVNTRQRKGEDGHSYRETLLTCMKRYEQVGGNMKGMMVVAKGDESISDSKHEKRTMQRLAAMMMFQ